MAEPVYALAGKRVYVAGHRGMVGQAICRRLEREDCTVLTAGRKDADFEQAYQEATKKHHGFLWVRLTSSNKNEKYWSSFTKRILFD